MQTRAAYILFYKRKDLAGKPMQEVIPRLNLTKFPGMPVRLKTGKVGYLIEYRQGHPCPYKVGFGANIVMYLSEQSVQNDPDTEDLSNINNMLKKKWKDAAPEEFSAQGNPEKETEKEKPKTTGKIKKKTSIHSDDSMCNIF